MGRRIITAITAMALALFGLGLSIGFAAPAQAASCTSRSGTAKVDPNTSWSWTTWWVCGNDAGVKLYLDANTGTVTGYMDTTTSWFVCYRRGAQHAGGNNVWYYTQGDRAAAGQAGRHAWGYMPAVNVHTSVDPWSGMAACPTSTSTSTPTPTPTPTPTRTVPARSNGYKTLILLHGYRLFGVVNCDNYWGGGEVERYLNARGWNGKVVKLSYYSGGGTGCTRIPGAESTDRSIDELGADLAWYIYGNYSSRGVPVDVIAHSMGGLVTRVAIAGTSQRRMTGSGRAFPPYLYVEDVATLSSPHEGARGGWALGCQNGNRQVCQMIPGSSWLASWILRPAGSRAGYDNPQSTMGTDWSAVGSGDDWVVNTGSALNISATYHFGHKYIYLSHSGLDHDQMANITQNGRSFTYKMRSCDFWAGCNMADVESPDWTQRDNAAGPLWLAAQAVYDSRYW